ncbi:hypothetical protein IWQ60_009273 [Tieghemiomyces parasiticus]|uniref:Uncharacterized protein n=1 Tax=Tieghemiomyces parasiticus TaxID=78921 RepID=A0A9W7ZUC9_9FUNG|nr:hypothetical protein IWQ60_009273 [Tieghemiomyces parasiticus]
MTHGQFAELELLAMVDNLHKVRIWRTFQMVRSDEGQPLYHVQDARSMKQLISDHADGVYPIHVSTVDFQDLLLTRVAYYGDTTVDAPPDSKTTAYFGYRPHADYMFLIRGTGIPRTPLFRTLTSVFRCATFSAYPLEGKNLTALSHTLLNQATQGPYALYRDYAALAHNPLEHRSQRGDLAAEVQLDHGTSDTAARHPVDGTGTVAEDQRQLDRQRVVVVHQLGLDPTATLDRLEFVHTAPLASSSSGATAPKESEVPADPVEVTMTVTFRGPDVVGGLRDLVSSGSTTGAYPEFLPTCLGRAANRFSVKVARGTLVRIDTLEKEGGGEAP